MQIALENAGIKTGKEGRTVPERKGIRLPAPTSGNKPSISGRHSSTPGNEDQRKKEQQKWPIAQTGSGDLRVAVRPRAQQDSHRTAAYPPLGPFPMGKDPRTRTQFGDGPFEENRVLVIGLDFGTSCTKVVIRDAILGTAYAVDFSNLGVSGSPYLLPSRIFCSTDGRLNLHNREHKFVGYKLRLMNHADNPILEEPTKNLSASPKGTTAGFIALTLQSARSWFLKNHGDNYARSRIIWQVNVGVPTGRISSDLHKIFYRAAYAGWLVSVDEGNVDLQRIKTALERVKGLIENQPSKHFSLKYDCEIHPEDVATVQK